MRVQVLLLIDCSAPVPHSALCLACTRLLLYLARFPSPGGDRFQWNYQLYSTEGEIKTQPKANHFKEVTSNILNVFFTELEEKCTKPMTKRTLTSVTPVQLLYNAMATGIQDHPWDAPDITSPLKRPRRIKRPHYKHNTHPHRFVLTQCILSHVLFTHLCTLTGPSHITLILTTITFFLYRNVHPLRQS